MKRISIIIIVVCRLLSAAWATHYSIPLTGGRMEVTAGRIRMVEGWLPGYTKRIKLTIDNTKIDAELTNFPVTVFLTSVQGEEIFSELDADADYMKVAFAASDGTNQLYAEKELFDVSESNAIYHVSKAGWTISSSGDTDFYMYYYNDASDNTTYIGAINTTAGATVWDSNFKAVYHMADDTTSNILDSTSNNNDGTKVNTPVEVDAQIGKGQQFVDGDSDYITCGQENDWDGATAITIALWIYDDDATEYYGFISKNNYETNGRQWTLDNARGKILIYLSSDGENYFTTSSTNEISSTTWTHVAFVWDKDVNDGKGIIYINGSEVAAYDAQEALTSALSSKDEPVWIGRKGSATHPRYMDGKLDEIQLSHNIARSAAWIAATYDSLWDTLVSYGDEER